MLIVQLVNLGHQIELFALELFANSKIIHISSLPQIELNSLY